MENQIPETEQWLLDGNCDKCRKDKYCDKDCGAYKRAIKKAMKEAYEKVMKRAKEKWDEEHATNNEEECAECKLPNINKEVENNGENGEI